MSGSGARNRSRFFFAQLNFSRSHGDTAAVGHSIPSVDHQVHQDLLELSAIRFDSVHSRVELNDQLDIGTDQAAQHAGDVCDDVVKFEHLRLDNFLAAESE